MKKNLVSVFEVNFTGTEKIFNLGGAPSTRQ